MALAAASFGGACSGSHNASSNAHEGVPEAGSGGTHGDSGDAGAPGEAGAPSGAGAPSEAGAPSSEPASLTWEKPGPNAPERRYEAQGLALDGKLYVFGGFLSGTAAGLEAAVFDLATRTWSTLSPMPETLTHAGRASDGRYLYFAGGFIGDGPGPSVDHVWKYDPELDAWTELPPLPADRGGGALALLDGKLHFFGGAVHLEGEEYFSADYGDHWTLALANPSRGWTALAPLPNPRNHLGGCAVNGRIFAIGGQHLNDETAGDQPSVDIYDPASDRWSPGPDLPLPVGHLTSNTIAYRERVLVVSGVSYDSRSLDTVFELGPELTAWRELTPLPQPRHSPVSDVLGDTLIVTGGSLKLDTWIGTLSVTER